MVTAFLNAIGPGCLLPPVGCPNDEWECICGSRFRVDADGQDWVPVS